jgi:hypothetical protein
MRECHGAKILEPFTPPAARRSPETVPAAPAHASYYVTVSLNFNAEECMRLLTRAVLAVLAALAPLAASPAAAQSPAARDTAFKSMQERGKRAMGVDQYTSTHKFDAYPTGGRIELQRDAPDSAGVAQIRAHLRALAAAFASGDFSTPAFVHIQDVPGAKVMRARRGKIAYQVHDLPRGAELHITTTDPEAVAAIREFMAFQRGEHHAGGMDGMKHSP